MFRWLAGRGATSRDTALQQARIEDAAWQAACAALPFLAGLSAREDASLRARAAWLLASKTFSGAHGIAVTDDIMLSIAIQAALPILELDTAWYEGWVEIIIYPGGFMIPRREQEDSGVVHEYLQEASGEAWEGGPVILSWEDAGPGQALRDNVVIHEFAHKLDLRSGDMEGMPSLVGTGISPAVWQQTLQQALDAFEAAVLQVEAAIPPDVDPESEDAFPWYASLPMDPYAATDEAEFFAVSSEVFFADPAPLADWFPGWYALLSTFYRQDPLSRFPQT
ncbi:zinc-dependent peptidase [Alcaligenaceae bacterium SJ-26]|nr:zinc-dependent peptidase [Alcaligenaceae bacterium SJ-26]